MTMPDIPAEAVEAAVSKQREVCWLGDPSEREAMRAALAAALPHLRERWLAEVAPDIHRLGQDVANDVTELAYRRGWQAFGAAMEKVLPGLGWAADTVEPVILLREALAVVRDVLGAGGDAG
jgi:hypothetical protein